MNSRTIQNGQLTASGVWAPDFRAPNALTHASSDQLSPGPLNHLSIALGGVAVRSDYGYPGSDSDPESGSRSRRAAEMMKTTNPADLTSQMALMLMLMRTPYSDERGSDCDPLNFRTASRIFPGQRRNQTRSSSTVIVTSHGLSYMC